MQIGVQKVQARQELTFTRAAAAAMQVAIATQVARTGSARCPAGQLLCPPQAGVHLACLLHCQHLHQLFFQSLGVIPAQSCACERRECECMVGGWGVAAGW